MRILHTSDWHLGRTLHGVDLLDHQSAYLDHLVEVVRSEGIDAVVVAGDVYDRAIPPVQAVELLSSTLRRLLEVTQVVVSPGNHDSAARLGFGADLMREGLHVRARSRDVGTAVELHDAEGGLGALVYALPYLDPDDARHVLAGEDGPLARSHEAVTTAALERVRADVTRRRARGGAPVPTVLAAHTFVVGGEVSESERDIRVGGVDSVPSGVLRGVDYVALGHLHGPQRVPVADLDGRRTVARYSGSPLAYSFSEMNHRKSSVVVDLRADGVHGEPELIEAPVPRRLTEVRGTLEEILGELGEAHVDCWTRVYVTDPSRPESLVARVRARLPHALAVLHEPPARTGDGAEAPRVAAADPFDVCCDFVAHVRGGGETAAPDETERAVLRRALENVLAAERSA
ncbi:exonuclease subunit SbcD [Sanguibacter hominis ATCC BAA-789]|uniref:Nuclease SbcCD subunit D n=1 Tax=Sanguibacter hominis ATCC BAA-789 TaxID=1312740 RepID=A0A9X5FA43_9MICO|nr:exonuclease SbcCD subunit D [Sanguibacter hominis]NKX92666.1 exonuclease subunit SbcD [Sanguibacter hominis ATCC BAA-789]